MLDVFTSFAALESGAELHVAQALENHRLNANVKNVHIVSESDEETLKSVYPILQDDKFRVHEKTVRPTFGMMIAAINEGFENSNIKLAALLNADICFSSEEDIKRVSATMQHLETPSNVLAITRHDRCGEAYAITLETEMGLPNLLTADGWIFDSPIEMESDLFYTQGQMNCDKFFAYDLHAAGCSLYNPCLDIKLLHLEDGVKDNSYYRSANAMAANKRAAIQHYSTAVKVHGGGYFGLVRVRSTDLISGYLPKPVSWARSHKFYLCMPISLRFEDIPELLDAILGFTKKHPRLEVHILFERESNRDQLVEWLANSKCRNIALSKIDDLSLIVNRILSGKSEGLDEVLLLNSAAIWSPESIVRTPATLLLCNPEVASIPIDVRGNPSEKIQIDNKFRIRGMSESLYEYVTNLLFGNERVIVLWHKTDRANQQLIEWLNQKYRRTF